MGEWLKMQISRIKLCDNDEEIGIVINKIYGMGFEDGSEFNDEV